MSWIKQQTRLTQCYVYVTEQLNSMGIYPGGSVIKPWIVEDMKNNGIVVSYDEILIILSGMIAENRIGQNDIDRVMSSLRYKETEENIHI